MERFAPVLKLSPSGRPWRPFSLPDPVPGSPWRPSPAPRRQISKNDNNNSVQSPLNAIIGSPPAAGPPPVPVPVPSSPGPPPAGPGSPAAVPLARILPACCRRSPEKSPGLWPVLFLARVTREGGRHHSISLPSIPSQIIPPAGSGPLYPGKLPPSIYSTYIHLYSLYYIGSLYIISLYITIRYIYT